MQIETGEDKTGVVEIVDEIMELVPKDLRNEHQKALNKVSEIIDREIHRKFGYNGKKYILLRRGPKYQKIFFDDIIFVETFGRKIIIHTKSEDIDYYGKLGDLEKVFGDEFYRTHRAYLVNTKHVLSFDRESIKMIKGEAIISKTKYHGFVEAIKEQAKVLI